MISSLELFWPAICNPSFESMAIAEFAKLLMRLIPDVFVHEDANAHEVEHVAYLM